MDLPELQLHAMLIAPATRYGGHVRTSVMVCEKPRVKVNMAQTQKKASGLIPSVCTAVGKKFLKPLAARCMCYQNVRD